MSSKSNQIPDNQPETLVTTAPQIPPTCLSFKRLPQRSPNAIKNIALGIITTIANLLF